MSLCGFKICTLNRERNGETPLRRRKYFERIIKQLLNSAFVVYEEFCRVLSTEAFNTLLDLQNSSYPSQPHSIIAKYTEIGCGITNTRRGTCETTTESEVSLPVKSPVLHSLIYPRIQQWNKNTRKWSQTVHDFRAGSATGKNFAVCSYGNFCPVDRDIKYREHNQSEDINLYRSRLSCSFAESCNFTIKKLILLLLKWQYKQCTNYVIMRV